MATNPNIYNASAPVIVQGHHPAPYTASPYNHSPPSNNAQDYKQQDNQQAYQAAHDEQHPQRQGGCRDAFWGILFYAHLCAIGYCTAVFAPQAAGNAMEGYNGGGERRMMLDATPYVPSVATRLLQEEENGEDAEVSLDIDPTALLSIVAVAGILGCIFSSLAMGFMIHFAEGLIKTALIFNVVLFGLMTLLSLAAGALPGAMMSGLMCAFAAYYAYRVWSRIPFAATNLVTAVTAVRANIGLALYAYISLILLFGWSIWWSISTVSTILVLGDCDADGECQNETSGALIFVFILSFYWTVQVISNVVHVTTAGTVGTWWFAPMEANGCCSKAVRDSYVRSLTTSFGSICFGSLIVALIQTIREMVRSMREDGDSLVACCADCILGCIESLMEYFNKWAFVYVGLYGFSFMEAGSNVMQLFRNRGWTSIITDLMVDTVLNMVSLGVGVLTALVALIIGSAFQLGEAGTLGAGALIGFILGFGMSATLFSVVSSATNTVIVCYAEAPNEFQTNHPELSNKMRNAWRQAWPNDFNY